MQVGCTKVYNIGKLLLNYQLLSYDHPLSLIVGTFYHEKVRELLIEIHYCQRLEIDDLVTD
jgi:hypothetical protein